MNDNAHHPMRLAARTHSGARKILIVEDHAEARQMLSIALNKVGFDVLSTSGGAAAMQMVREKNPSIVLLDIGLSDAMNGLTVCEKIRAHAPSRHMHVILTSGRKDKDTLDEARRVGADAYLVKPFRLSRLLEIISSERLWGGGLLVEMDA